MALFFIYKVLRYRMYVNLQGITINSAVNYWKRLEVTRNAGGGGNFSTSFVAMIVKKIFKTFAISFKSCGAVVVVIVWFNVVGFISTYPISGNHHKRSEFEPHSGEVYSIQHYVIKFVSDLRQVGGFLWVLLLPPPIKLTATI